MPVSTAWRASARSLTRGGSPIPPSENDIERISPEPTSPAHLATHNIAHETLHGLGLSQDGQNDADMLYGRPEEIYIDRHGGAHVRGQRKQSSRNRSSQLNSKTSKGKGHTRSGSTIDDLASAAIATSPTFANGSPHHEYAFGGSLNTYSPTRPSTSHLPQLPYHDGSLEPPAKRVKSERLPAVEWDPQPGRPATSYSYTSTHEEAALLLSLRHEVNFKIQPSPVPVIAQLHQSSPQEYRPRSPILPAQTEFEGVGLNIHGEEPRSELKQTSIAQPAHSPLTNGESGQPDTEMLDSAENASKPIDRSPSAQRPAPVKKPRRVKNLIQEVCAECHKVQRETDDKDALETWICCNACNKWFHAACAGISSKAEARSVDKFICKSCEPEHGKTTFVRKSSRAKTALDYAAVNQGLTQSSDEVPQHHYIQPIKTGRFPIQPDDFARIRPELLTMELYESFDHLKRPFVVPAAWNPRFGAPRPEEDLPQGDSETATERYAGDSTALAADKVAESENDTEEVIDCEQDLLDMIMPRDLTVRKVSRLVGPHLTVPVINVKTQETVGLKTLEEWADYYEKPMNEDKPIYNVISLEVSNSKLGRLIRRPKVVRDLDLEEQVWDAESRSSQKKRPVQFYCLMSVADSYTDFHIDFGGSSVYYHILKGTKTFFFIPPEDKYLKEYEKWCNSHSQNDTWLPDLCGGNVTRVDLHEGDTAFIPAGWIHSVWTPEDSLVIGGNFLTRVDYELQFKVAQVEKATHVAPAFKYPFFQKVMWYALLTYLEDDPVPDEVMDDFQADQDYTFLRADPIWHEIGDLTNTAEPDSEVYNARYYPKAELKGLPSLRDYLYRTARVYADLPVPDITKKQIDAVKASIPKGHGDPLQLIKTFAIWCAWKVGNVTAPEWVHSDIGGFPEVEKKAKKPETYRLPGERTSQRKSAQAASREATGEAVVTIYKPGQNASGVNSDPNKKGRPASHKPNTVRTACESCRKRRVKCRHRENGEDMLSSRSQSPIAIAAAPPSLDGLPGVTRSIETFPSLETGSSDTYMNSNLAQAALATLDAQGNTSLLTGSPPNSGKKSRSKACEECRKSKRRCVHDEYGRVDPAKAAEPSKPRGSSNAKRPSRPSDEHLRPKQPKIENESRDNHVSDAMIDPALFTAQVSSTVEDMMQTDLPNGESAEAVDQAAEHVATDEDTVMRDVPPTDAPAIKEDPDQMESPVLRTTRSSVEFAESAAFPEHAIEDTPDGRPVTNGDTNRVGTSPASQRHSSRQMKQTERYMPEDHRSPSKTLPKAGMEGRRASSAASGHSIVNSVKSQRSSSNTSTTIHVTQLKKLPVGDVNGRARSRESTAESELDADEKLARELQAAEHGLRRRASMRA